MDTYNVRLSRYHLFLLFSIIISPFTELRFTFFGISEVIIIIAFIHEFFSKSKKSAVQKFHFTKFWILFIVIITLSLLFNLVTQEQGKDSITISKWGFDYISYWFVLITCFVYEKVFVRANLNTYLMMKYMFLISSSLCAILFLVSFYSDSIFNLNLFYYDRFSPLASNPHKISMFLIVLPFLGFKIMSLERNRALKISVLCLIILDVIMIIKTGTSKGVIGVFGGITLYLYYTVLSNKVLRTGVSFFLFVAILFGFMIGNIGDLIIDYIISIDSGGARNSLYSKGLMIAFDNLLIGSGPGVHIFHNGNFMDSHQSFLTVLLQGGVIALFSFMFILFKIYRKIKYDHVFLCMFAAIFVYILGGDIMRWNFVWIIFILKYNYNKSDELKYKLNRERKTKKIL